jgi:hypothetical protein
MGAGDRIGDISANLRYSGSYDPTPTDIGCGAWDYVLESRRYEAQAEAQRRIDEADARRVWCEAQALRAQRAFVHMTADERRQFIGALKILQPADSPSRGLQR